MEKYATAIIYKLQFLEGENDYFQPKTSAFAIGISVVALILIVVVIIVSFDFLQYFKS